MSKDQQADEFAGQGGSYTRDPKTGKRALIERTKEPQPQAPAAPAEAEATLPPLKAKKE